MAVHIRFPDGVIADIEALILAEGRRGAVLRLVDPDVLHLVAVQAVAVVHDVPAHDVLDLLLVAGLLRHGGHFFQINVALGEGADAEAHDQRRDAGEGHDEFPCFLHTVPPSK